MAFQKINYPQFEGQLTVGDLSSLVRDGDVAADQDLEIIEQWQPIVDLVLQTTRDGYTASPPFDASAPAVFQSYWRGVFSTLRASIASNPDCPQFVTSPPIKGFEVSIFDENDTLCCPCDLPMVPPNIKIHQEDGVTVDKLVETLGEYLYGEARQLPDVYVTVWEGESVKGKGALVHDVSWMTKEGREGGNVAYLTYFAKGIQVGGFVVFCCTPAQYLKRVEEREERTKKQQEMMKEREEREKASGGA